MTAPVQDSENVRSKIVWSVAAGTVVLSAIFVVIAWALVESPPQPARPISNASPLENALFDVANHGQDSIAAGRRELDRYDWVDREAGVVRIPIDRAIDAVVADPSLIGRPKQAVTEVRP
ncbi:MAG TPA: hypothetical protein VGO00_07035 [Kofleriaceae bacterium]|nr:hypothetical protein [Kofleriaceae bacterium]